MKLKTLAAAIALAASSMSANALLLDGIGGNVNFKMIGKTTENAGCLGLGAGAGCETTWGVGAINSIEDTSTLSTVWSPSMSGNNDYLAFMIYGIADAQYTSGGTYGTNIFNVGATAAGQTAAGQSGTFVTGADGLIHLDVYRKATPFAISNNLANRTAYDKFTSITDVGTLYLDLTLDPGILATDDGATAFNELLTSLLQNANSTSLSGSIQGTGAFYASVKSGGTGTGDSKWDTNGFPLPGGGTADFSGNFTLKPNTGNANFPGLINDPINANAIPEPGSLALLAGALFGLAGLRRRMA